MAKTAGKLERQPGEEEEISVTRSSANIFAYLGLPYPEDELAKANLVI